MLLWSFLKSLPALWQYPLLNCWTCFCFLVLVFLFRQPRAVLLFPSCCFTGQPRQMFCQMLSPSPPPQSDVSSAPVQHSGLSDPMNHSEQCSICSSWSYLWAIDQVSVDWACRCWRPILHVCNLWHLDAWFIYLFLPLPACLPAVCLSPILPSETLILSLLPLSLGPKVENSQNLSSSEPRSLQESKEHVKREQEGITVRFPRENLSLVITKHKLYHNNEFIADSFIIFLTRLIKGPNNLEVT